MSTDTPAAIALDDNQHAVTFNGVAAPLTDSEYRVLKALISKPGIVVTRTELSYALYSGRDSAATSNVLEVLIARLRRVLTNMGARGAIKTTRGAGYSYVGAAQ